MYWFFCCRYMDLRLQWLGFARKQLIVSCLQHSLAIFSCLLQTAEKIIQVEDSFKEQFGLVSFRLSFLFILLYFQKTLRTTILFFVLILRELIKLWSFVIWVINNCQWLSLRGYFYSINWNMKIIPKLCLVELYLISRKNSKNNLHIELQR